MHKHTHTQSHCMKTWMGRCTLFKLSASSTWKWGNKYTFLFKNRRLCLKTLTTSRLYATGIVVAQWTQTGGNAWCFHGVQTCQVLIDIHPPQECFVFITVIHSREVGHYTECVTRLTDDNLKARNLCIMQFACWIDYSRQFFHQVLPHVDRTAPWAAWSSSWPQRSGILLSDSFRQSFCMIGLAAPQETWNIRPHQCSVSQQQWTTQQCYETKTKQKSCLGM